MPPRADAAASAPPAPKRRVTNRTTRHLSSQRPAPRGRSEPDYTALVQAAAAGSRDAMETLLLRAQEVAYRFSMTVCGHPQDAEDVMQEALIKTFRHASEIRDPEAFRPWLYRTVRNACLMRRRLRVDEPRHVLSLEDTVDTPDGPRRIDAPAPDRDPEQVAINTRLRRRLHRAMQGLSGGHRMVLFLREMEGLSTREVAEVMGLSEANVKQRLHRARLYLQRELGDV